MRHRSADQGGAVALAARRGKHADAADLEGGGGDEQAGGAGGGAVQHEEEMGRCVVEIIELIGLGYALLFDEDRAAQSAAGGDVAGRADVRTHAK
jgi:hypothetical protein